MNYSFIKKEREESRVTEDEIAEIENNFHLKFPSALRNFYLEHNDALIYTCYPVFHDEEDLFVTRIYGLKYPSSSFEKIREILLDNEFYDPKLVPFAQDGCGDCYYWHLDTGKIYIVYDDDVENPLYLCDSIDAFFSVLCACEHDED